MEPQLRYVPDTDYQQKYEELLQKIHTLLDHMARITELYIKELEK